jgi:hypothetical protein
MLWCAGRPTFVLPLPDGRLRCDSDLALILTHELAHLKRHDHWIRLIESLVSSIYWWNPLVWFIREQLHQSEDLCCDSWVRWAFPECRSRYAEVLLETAESVTASDASVRSLPACPFLGSMSLKGRIQMILRSRFAPRASTTSLLAIGLAALLTLPSFIRLTPPRANANDERAQAKPDQKEVAAPTEFPHLVKFEQGATKFLDGDKITIEEIRGTSETFSPGNFYQVKGTYKLASHARASVSVYVTAVDAKFARSNSQKSQSTIVERGEGMFTLVLPMTCPGLPHVSF